MPHTLDERKRWLALMVLCLGVLMIVLDTTIVNVALPSIKADLGFTEASLVWVVNAYMLTFGCFLLLGGRLGDLLGQRRMFLAGLTLFTLASLACGWPRGRPCWWPRARCRPGRRGRLGRGPVADHDAVHRAGRARPRHGRLRFRLRRRRGIGVLLGGLLTSSLSWHWIFLVNLPIGALVYALCLPLLPASQGPTGHPRLDLAGAAAITASLMLAVYAVVNGNEAGWTSPQSLGLLALAVALLALFLRIEARVPAPLMPLSLFALRNVATANIVGVLWAAAMFAWFFISALYMQLVLGYTAMQVGLGFLPANIIMAAFSLGLSARLVMRFDIRAPLVCGLLVAALGLALFARAPVAGSFAVDVLPGMLLLGLGAGIAFNPVLLAAMSDVDPSEAGLASGVVNTSFMMGGALGLAVLASLAAGRSASLRAGGADVLTALNGGYHAAFAVGAVFAALAALLAGVLLRRPQPGASAPAADAH